MTMASEAAIGEETAGGGAADLGTTDEVKTLLQSIATLIADADRRHGEALVELQSRVASLGDEARRARGRVPAHYQDAFGRIEDSIALLAERIAQTEAEREARGEHQPGVAAATSPVATPLAEGADHAHTPAPTSPPPANEGSAPAPAATAPVIDTFDVAEADMGRDGDSPWDHEQAEALTRLYEAGEAGLQPMALKVSPGPAAIAIPPPTRDVQPAAAAAAAPLAATPAEPATASDPHGEMQREWLEAKFAEIAERVEQSLAGMRPDGAIAGLETRFDQLESRFTTALEDVAGRTDPEALRLVEAQINELALHVEDAQAQLQRLGSIEAQLNAVVEQLSDQRLAELLDHSGQMSQHDLQGVALAAAEEVAARMAAIQPAQSDAPAADTSAEMAEQATRINELRDLLHSFMIERRQGEENTASMLDTMQHAMIRLLDRVEAIEVTQTQPPVMMAQLEAPAQQPAPAAAVALPPVAMAMADAGPTPGATPAVVDREPAAPESVRLAEPAPSAETQVRPAQHGEMPAHAGDKPLSLEQLRAAARRAQAAAAEAAQAETAKKPAKGTAAKTSGAAKPAKSDLGGSSAKRHLLVGALVLAAMIPAALMIVPKLKSGAPAKSNVSIERPTPGTQAGQPAQQQPAQPVQKDRGASLSPQLSPEQASDAEQAEAITLASATTGDGQAGDAEAAPAVTAQAGRATDGEAGTIAAVGGLPGVTIQEPSRALSADDIARLRNQAQMARISGQLGAAQARMAGAGSAAGARPQAATDIVTGSIASAPAAPGRPAQELGASTSGLDIPPAMVGPLSLRMAAAKGDPSAQFEVAARFAEGKGVPQDFKQALVWYQRSAAQGLAQAQYRLGTLFERGLGTPVDLAQARQWYQQSAEQGSVKAMHNLAVLSAGRDAGTPDYTAAAQWFQQAAERGLPDSQFNLAVLSENGLGVAKNPVQAYKWYSLAANAGDKESVRRRDLLKAKMAAAELAQAEALVKGFLSRPTDKMANDARTAGEAWKARQATASN